MPLKNAKIPILGFAAHSGTGKTTLLSRLIPLLRQEGLRVGLIKHSHHRFDIDTPGKDSYRLRQAGATPVMVVSRHRRAIVCEIAPPKEPRLDDELSYFNQDECDLILVEGFKREAFPKIELHRPVLKKPLLCPDDSNVIAVASDIPLSLPAGLPLLDLNQPTRIADFILHHFLRRP